MVNQFFRSSVDVVVVVVVVVTVASAVVEVVSVVGDVAISVDVSVRTTV